jgi:hypothetical protein
LWSGSFCSHGFFLTSMGKTSRAPCCSMAPFSLNFQSWCSWKEKRVINPVSFLEVCSWSSAAASTFTFSWSLTPMIDTVEFDFSFFYLVDGPLWELIELLTHKLFLTTCVVSGTFTETV